MTNKEKAQHIHEIIEDLRVISSKAEEDSEGSSELSYEDSVSLNEACFYLEKLENLVRDLYLLD